MEEVGVWESLQEYCSLAQQQKVLGREKEEFGAMAAVRMMVSEVAVREGMALLVA